MSDPLKPSAVEITKVTSDFLSGTIGQELENDVDFFDNDAVNLLKHHGSYQQQNRDLRKANKGGDKAHFMMVRTRIPGGRLTSAQLLAELDICDQLGCGNMRFTTRQAIQHHGVVKSNLRSVIRRINEIQLSTLAACGDVVRNVMCCPAPYHNSGIHQEIKTLTDEIVRTFEPRTRAYHEIWLRDPETGEDQLVSGGAKPESWETTTDAEGYSVEPIYGRVYLPRKFKFGIGLTTDNCADVYADDLGILGIVQDGKIIGYNILVGGGMGTTPSMAKTFPAVGKRLAFVSREEVIAVSKAVVMVQRDYGNRNDRKLARIKYLIHAWGMEKFKSVVEQYYGKPLAEPHPDDVTAFHDHLEWNEQGDGRWWYGLNIENGRIHDSPEIQLKAALREICRTLEPGIRLTSHQSILFTDLHEDQKPVLEEILVRHGIRLSREISNARRWSMACVAWPTCGMAITESERALPGIIDQIEVELAKLGLSSEIFTIRMTGCNNGCARPYNSDIGLVGRGGAKYAIYLGGRTFGNRLNFQFRNMVPHDDLVATLVPVFQYFKHQREAGETLGDFCHRKGLEDLLAWTDQYAEEQTAVASTT